VEVFLANEQGLVIDEGRLVALARHVLNSEDADAAQLSVLLVTSDHMKQLNSRFAGEDYATDVLSFPMDDDVEEENGEILMGDVVICPVVGRRNARRLGHSLRDELDVLLVHGTLHLLGYDHQNDGERAEMDNKMKEVLVTFKSSR
jgi:probable rRNA maturation factor